MSNGGKLLPRQFLGNSTTSRGHSGGANVKGHSGGAGSRGRSESAKLDRIHGEGELGGISGDEGELGGTSGDEEDTRGLVSTRARKLPRHRKIPSLQHNPVVSGSSMGWW